MRNINEILWQITFLISILFAISKSKEAKIISLDLKNDFSSYDLYLQLGPGNVNQRLEIDMSIDCFWICLFNFQDKDIERTHKTVTIKIRGIKQEAEALNTTIQIPSHNISLSNFPLFYVYNKNVFGFDSFPLAYQFHDKKLSIIHALYYLNYVDHLSFGLSYSISKKKGKLYLGGIPEEIIQNYKESQFCNVIEGYNTWGCNLTQVSFLNYSYNNEFYSYFQSNKIEILVPQNFFSLFKEKLIKPYLLNQTCFSEQYYNGIIDCFCERLEYFPTIFFDFGSVIIPLNKNDTFYYKDSTKKCSLNIKINSQSKDKWVFGTMFIHKYFSYFDYENKIITFYSQNPINSFKGNYKRHILTQKSMIIILSIILIFCCFLIIWHKTQKKFNITKSFLFVFN